MAPHTGGHDEILNTAVGPRKIVVWQGDPSLPPYVIVAGYCHSSETLARKIQAKTLRSTNRTVIGLERLGIGTDARPDHIGWWGLCKQLRDFVAIVEALVAAGWIRKELAPTWIGHSLGAHFIAELKLAHPALVGELVLLAPPPPIPFALLCYLRLWQGGWVALPSVLWSMITGQGAQCPLLVKHLLFAGKRATAAELGDYTPALWPDAGVVFLQMLLGYGWLYGKGLRLLRSTPECKVTVVACRHDWIMPLWASVETAMRMNARLVVLNAAHCFWVHGPAWQAATKKLQKFFHRTSV